MVDEDTHEKMEELFDAQYLCDFPIAGGIHQFILARNIGTSTAMLEEHYGHSSNVASAAELTKSENFNATSE